MIKLNENLWIGDSQAADSPNRKALKINAVLNVAQDLKLKCGWPDVEYAQVGLVDGPGNTPEIYCAAALTLAAYLRRGLHVLVCCHSGGRSLAVVIMCVNMISQRGWDEWLALLGEKCEVDLPKVHVAHRAAFEAINWRLVGTIQ